MLLRLIFRNLKVRLQSTSGDGYRKGRIDITIFKPVSTNCLFMHLLKVPMRLSMNAKSFMGLPQHVGKVLLKQGGYLFPDKTPVSESSCIIGPLLYLYSARWEYVACLAQPELQFHLSTPAVCGEAVLSEHVEVSLWELLKVAGRSHGAVCEKGTVRSEKDYILKLPPTPRIAVKLSTTQLSPLVQRVSRVCGSA